jgi:hypothetical protein
VVVADLLVEDADDRRARDGLHRSGIMAGP